MSTGYTTNYNNYTYPYTSSYYNNYNTSSTASNLYGTNTLSSLSSGYYNNSSNAAGSLPSTTSSLLVETSNAMARKLFNSLDKNSSNLPESPAYTSSPVGKGLSFLDLTSTLLANTVPFINTDSSWKSVLENAPQVFQLMTSITAVTQMLKESGQTPRAQNELSSFVRSDLETESELLA